MKMLVTANKCLDILNNEAQYHGVLEVYKYKKYFLTGPTFLIKFLFCMHYIDSEIQL